VIAASLPQDPYDPFVVNGLRTYELKEWTIMEGTLGLPINLSDQSIEVA